MDPERGVFMIDLLETYKCLPCLWDHNDKFFAVKHARDQAHEILLEKYKKIHPDGTLEEMKKKIDNMRASYKREYKKVLQLGNTHYPKLWYYKYLKFLDEDKTTPNEKKKAPDFSEDEEYLNESMLESPEIMYLEEPVVKKIKTDSAYLEDDECKDDDALEFEPPTGAASLENYSTSKSNQDNATESFGKTVGLQLRELGHKQRIIAEKLISEIIFYGRQNKLEFNSTFNC